MILSKSFKISSLLLIFCFTFACAADPNPKRAQIELKIGPAILKTEIAKTDKESQLGLMYRTDLGKDEAMVFIFDSDQPLQFWMKNCLFDIDVAYIDSSGKIREIHSMRAGVEKTTDSNFSARYALEVKKGGFDLSGIKVGDMMDLSLLKK